MSEVLSSFLLDDKLISDDSLSIAAARHFKDYYIKQVITLSVYEIVDIRSLVENSVIFLYLVGTGTSVRPVIRTAGANRTKAIMGFSRKSTSPTSTLEASAPGGIFFMKFIST